MTTETLTRPAYRVLRYVARFDGRDAICGWDGRSVECARTERHAFLIASRLGRWDDGEAYTKVIREDDGREVTHPAIRAHWAAVAAGTVPADEIPF